MQTDLEKSYRRRRLRLRRLRRDLLWLSREKLGLLSSISKLLALDILDLLK